MLILQRWNSWLMSQLEQSPGDQIPHLALISFQELILKKSSHRLLSFAFASMGPKDEWYFYVLLTTNKAKQTLPGTVTGWSRDLSLSDVVLQEWLHPHSNYISARESSWFQIPRSQISISRNKRS